MIHRGFDPRESGGVASQHAGRRVRDGGVDAYVHAAYVYIRIMPTPHAHARARRSVAARENFRVAIYTIYHIRIYASPIDSKSILVYMYIYVIPCVHAVYIYPFMRTRSS
jgi:hypothetical protein